MSAMTGISNVQSINVKDSMHLTQVSHAVHPTMPRSEIDLHLQSSSDDEG